MKLSTRFQEALAVAAQLHGDQIRKGTDIPYISHLLAVASIVLDNGADEDVAIAALLHDAVEDQGGPSVREKIRSLFGDRVASIVDGCTDAEVTPKPPWRQRKEAYLTHLRGASESVRLVSASDKLHNARAILGDYRELGDSLWARFNAGKEGVLWYYRSLVQVFRATGTTPGLIDELDRGVSELERLASLKEGTG